MSKKRDMDGVVAVAVLTLKKPGAMTDDSRKHIARWLRRQANNLVKLGSEYNDTGSFHARYYVEAKDPL